MARRKGQKCWEGIHRDGWLALYGDTTVMTDLMMEIFACLYHSPDRTDNAKHIAQILNMEYRALNAAVGWAGNKIKDICEAERKADAASQKSHILVSGDEPQPDMSPWEYVFNGIEDEDGTYLWIMKEAAADAFREMEEANLMADVGIRDILSRDISSYGREGSLFSQTPDQTIALIREWIEERDRFTRKSLTEHAQCTVCLLYTSDAADD